MWYHLNRHVEMLLMSTHNVPLSKFEGKSSQIIHNFIMSAATRYFCSWDSRTYIQNKGARRVLDSLDIFYITRYTTPAAVR